MAAFQVLQKNAWLIVLSLAFLAVLIMFLVNFRPTAEGGWLVAFLNAINEFILKYTQL